MRVSTDVRCFGTIYCRLMNVVDKSIPNTKAELACAIYTRVGLMSG